MNKYYLAVITLLVTVTLFACGQIDQSSTEPGNHATSLNGDAETPQQGTKRVIGLILIDKFPDLIVIDAPPEVHANQPFTVTIATYGSSSCTTVDGADVQVTDVVVEITPYDRQPIGDNVVCTADLASHPREVVVTLSTLGHTTIRVVGQNFDGESIVEENIVTVIP